MWLRAMITAAALVGAQACAAAPTSLLSEAAGATAQTLCTKAFASGIDPARAFREHLQPEPGMGLIAWSVRYDVDRAAKEVRVSVMGGVRRRAVYREGRACTLAYAGVADPTALTSLPHAPADLPPIADDALHVSADPRVIAALDAAFAEPTSGPPRRTQAVVVVHKGKLIAERYAAGLGPTTPLLSHSLAKSVVSALAGVAVREGMVRLDAPAPIDAWRAVGDARGAITLENLLRMNAGFGFDEGGGASVATDIWFNEADTAAQSARAIVRTPPGAEWGYCSRCYTLAARIVADAVGGGPQGFHDFAQRTLFDPLGMTSAQFEFDAAGTPMGANAMLATPRDFAKFGLLMLNDGIAGDRRILPEDWVKAVTTPTGDAGYGAGFWLNTTSAPIRSWGMNWGMPGAPADAYFARGYLGQYIVIVPSADLVLVRFGQSHGRAGEIESVGALVGALIAATRA